MKDDLAELAVLDAYKWWVVTDFGFLQLTGVLDLQGRDGNRTGSLQRDKLRRIAQAYTVSRNIPSHDEDRQAEELARLLSGEDVAKLLKLPFAKRAAALRAFIDENPVRLKADEKGVGHPRKIASALTKLTWFLQPEDWTIFDKFVGVAVLRRQGTGATQMANYYEALAKTWPQVSKALCDACVEHGFDRRLGYRIVDKYLFLHGSAMFTSITKTSGESGETLDKFSKLQARLNSKSTQATRASLRSFAMALPDDLSTRLTALGRDVHVPLGDAGWVVDPA